MTKEIEKIYLDFFDYYETVKEKLDFVYQCSDIIDVLFDGIIDDLKYYFNNVEDVSFKDEVYSYFENEAFLNSIVDKVKNTIEYVFFVFYEVCSCDVELFNQYVGIMYYISILEDLIMYLEHNNIDSTNKEQELQELKNIIYNKNDVVDEFNEYIAGKIEEVSKTYESFFPSVLIFKLSHSILFNKENEEVSNEEYTQMMIDEFLNNMGSFEEVSKAIKSEDLVLYNKILKLENVVLKLQYGRQSNQVLFEENNKEVIQSFIIELTHLYNVWLTELHRVFDLYGIDYVVKYKDLIYCSAQVKNIIETFSDIKDSNNENMGEYFIACYESILENNLDDIEQYTLYGEELFDQLCEYHELITNKLEEQIEFLYNKFTKK